MNKQDKDILKRIKKLKSQLPGYWIDVAKEELGVEKVTVYAYARGTRGMKEGWHKDVLRILLRIEAEEIEKASKLLQ